MVESESQKQARTNFGRLLYHYRLTQELTQSDLARALTMQGFQTSSSTVNRYEFGLRTPSAEFIVQAARYLNLSQDQETALVNACVLDYQVRFVREYLDARKRVGNT